MSEVEFKIEDKAIVIPVIVEMEDLTRTLYFLVDTGASQTLICEHALRLMGNIPANADREVPIKGIGGPCTVPVHIIPSITALGVTRQNLEVLSSPMPERTGAQGLLGFDFFEGRDLYISFRKGTIRLD